MSLARPARVRARPAAGRHQVARGLADCGRRPSRLRPLEVSERGGPQGDQDEPGAELRDSESRRPFRTRQSGS
jgi:hypothetical protein